MLSLSRRLCLGLAGGIAAAVTFASVALPGSVPSALAYTNCTVSDVSLDAEERAFLTLINDYRSQNGLGALTVSENLTRASTWMGGDMGAKGYFSHTDSLGRSPSTRAQDCGYPSGAGENIAAGTAWDTAQEAFTAWRNSSGHNANMLNGSYKQIGIARVYVPGSRYGWYWVTNFGLVNDGTNMLGGSAPAPTQPPATPTQPPATPSATQPPAPTATPAPAAGAVIQSPANNSVLPGSTVTFRWTRPSGSREFRFDLGLTPGGRELYSRTFSSSYSSLTLRGIPTDGRTLYVRFWTRTSAGWTYNDYVYRAAP